MFSVILRGGLTLLMAAVLIWVWANAMNPFIDVLGGFETEESGHVEYLATTVEWMPIIVLLSVIILIIAAAIAQRDATGGI